MWGGLGDSAVQDYKKQMLSWVDMLKVELVAVVLGWVTRVWRLELCVLKGPSLEEGVRVNFLPECLGLIVLLRSPAAELGWFQPAASASFPPLFLVLTAVGQTFNRIENSVCKSKICSDIWLEELLLSLTFLKVETGSFLLLNHVMLAHCTVISSRHTTAYFLWHKLGEGTKICIQSFYCCFFSPCLPAVALLPVWENENGGPFCSVSRVRHKPELEVGVRILLTSWICAFVNSRRGYYYWTWWNGGFLF